MIYHNKMLPFGGEYFFWFDMIWNLHKMEKNDIICVWLSTCPVWRDTLMNMNMIVTLTPVT